MKTFIDGDTYDTPPDRRLSLGWHLSLHNRWYLFGRFIAIILKYRKSAQNGTYGDADWVRSSYQVLQAIEDCGGRFHVKGLDHLRKSPREPVVFIGNHMSTLETVILPLLIVPIRSLTFVVKDALVKNKLFGPVMRSRNPVVVGRSSPREDLQTVLKQGKEVLANKRSIVIFPQSTRQDGFDPEKFNSLGVKLASRAKVKVIPMALKTDYWGNGRFMKDAGPLSPEKGIYIEFGEPMPITGNGKQEHKKIVEFIQSRLAVWKEK